MTKVLITTVPFANMNRLPLELLEGASVDYAINPLGRKLIEDELAEMAVDVDVIIAGTEPVTKKVMEKAKNLKLISRVGIGLDSVDLVAAKSRGIAVSYTPDAPAPAVAELTIGLLLSLLRSIHISNSELHKGIWHRHFGRRIPEVTIGIIGAGRIGSRVIRRLSAFGSPRVLVNDINPQTEISPALKLEWVDKDTIYKEADVISVHTPLTRQTVDLISDKEIALMKKGILLINVARGGIINEKALEMGLKSGDIGGAAIDVFNQEPYLGELANIAECILTAHMGSMSLDCRVRMEIEATEEVVRFVKGVPLKSPVPLTEYQIQEEF